MYIEASLYYELSRRGVSVTNQSCVIMPAEGNFHTERLYFESTPRGRCQTAQSPCSAFRDQRVRGKGDNANDEFSSH